MGIDPVVARARGAPQSVRAGLALGLLAVGCSSAPPKESAPVPAATSGLERYLPLVDATVFSYDTRIEPTGERGLLVLEVRRRREIAELVVAGRVKRLTVSNASIDLVTGGSLLREPLTEGATFRGDFGQVRVTSVARTVTVPAGTFTGCIETREEVTTSEGTKRTTTAFCPSVGIALRETEAEQGGERGTERLELRSFGKRFEAGL